MKRGSKQVGTPLIRTLLRVTLLLGLISSLLSTGTLRGSAAARELPPAERLPDCIRHQPAFCGVISRIAVDYLGEPIGPADAFRISTGELASGRIAPFHVYALNDPGYRYPYANVTFERQTTEIRVRAPRGGSDLSGRVYYSEAYNTPVQYFAPAQQTPADRIAFVDFAYHCFCPAEAYRSRFILTLRGTDRPLPPETADTLFTSPVSSTGSDTARPELAGAWQSSRVIPERGPRETRLRVTGALHVSNDGQAEAAPTRLVLFLSADRVLGPEDRLLGFRDVPALAAGAATELEADYTIPAPVLVGSVHLIALLDSSNTEPESNEQDNQVASRPLER